MVVLGQRFTHSFFVSETFERLRSSKYTPSVSHLLDSSLREGAGNGLCHSPGYSLKSDVTGDFHRPYATQKILVFTIHRSTLPQSRPLGVPAPSEREPGLGLHHSTGYSLMSGVTGDFHRPYETQKFLHFTVQPGGWGNVYIILAKKLT